MVAPDTECPRTRNRRPICCCGTPVRLAQGRGFGLFVANLLVEVGDTLVDLLVVLAAGLLGGERGALREGVVTDLFSLLAVQQTLSHHQEVIKSHVHSFRRSARHRPADIKHAPWRLGKQAHLPDCGHRGVCGGRPPVAMISAERR